MELFEGRESPLYHGTSWVAAAHILEKNEIEARSYHDASKLLRKTEISDYQVAGVSLTRDYRVARTFGEIVFVLDQQKLVTRHEIIPIDFFSKAKFMVGRGDGGGESEEFVVGPITNLDRYLTEIRITKKWYDANISSERAERIFTNGVAGLDLLISHPKLRVV